MADATDRSISREQRTLVERLWCERLALRGICRAVGVSLTWLLHFMVECFAAYPDHVHVQPPTRPTAVVLHLLEAEAAELWSFVKKKAKKLWVWLAMDARTRQIIALHVGDRSRDSANALWAKIPLVHREQARFHTDQYAVYKGVMPADRHTAITKKARFNNTLRQRLSRFVRDTLSFSKTVEHYIGAIKLFICRYNLPKAVAYPV